jgi:hypothetical protein
MKSAMIEQITLEKIALDLAKRFVDVCICKWFIVIMCCTGLDKKQ